MKTQTRRCTKRRFDEIGAKLALATIQHRDSPRRPKSECAVYFHTACKRWHLTSMPRGH